MKLIPKIQLLEIDEALGSAFHAGLDSFHRIHAARAEPAAEFIGDVLDQSLKLLREVPRERPFGCYLTIDQVESVVVGTCGFTSGPDENDSVEMAYYTFPPFEGRGYATAAAEGMLSLARESGRVKCVFAHTLPKRNVSCRILEKLGVRFVGEVIHPTDGRVWRWELPLNSQK